MSRLDLPKEERAGLYVTLIVHLSILIILLIVQIGATRTKETSFVLDFTRQEELEKQQKEEEQLLEQIEKAEQMRAAIQEKINRQLGEIPSIKNITTNRGALKDDKGGDGRELMKEAAKMEDRLRDKSHIKPDEDYSDGGAQEEGKNDKPEQAYSGATVLSWQLDGRRAIRLPVPAYKCYGGGTVTVIITVDTAGRVTDAAIQSGSTDKCLTNAALTAARNSRFNADSKAQAKQIGNIVYEFIPQ